MEETWEIPDRALIEKLLAGENPKIYEIKSASLKTVLSAWVSDPVGAAEGVGVKRARVTRE